MTDEQFFTDYPDRQARIRPPGRVPDESEGEFWSLGPHDKYRRRILVYRVPEDNPVFSRLKQPLMKIPFLLFSDETVEDRDDVLLPIIHEIMQDKAKEYGIDV